MAFKRSKQRKGEGAREGKGKRQDETDIALDRS